MRDELSNLLLTFEALGPLVGHAVKSRQLFNPQCHLTDPDPDVLVECDVRIPMSEDFDVTANVYRSKKAAEAGEPMPVVMCAHPYDNHLTPELGNTPLGGPLSSTGSSRRRANPCFPARPVGSRPIPTSGCPPATLSST